MGAKEKAGMLLAMSAALGGFNDYQNGRYAPRRKEYVSDSTLD
jgi:hypothetical protein